MPELSTHKVEVVPITLEKHPNADTLSVVTVFGGYPCCVKSTDWVGKTLGAYIPPDAVVDVTRPEFSFLAKGTKTKHRVRCVKLRGVQSYGLLMPAPEGSQVGDDVATYYAVEHYEPEMKSACFGGEAEQAPTQLAMLSKYDVDSMRRYSAVFEQDEPVMITEKIHGANSRFVYLDGRMWCGSRGEWKRQEENNLWWKALANTPTLGEFCRNNPGLVVYGEVYGDVQSLRYGCKKGEVCFAAFDILQPNGQYMMAEFGRELLIEAGVPVVPLVVIRGFDFNAICELAEGPSLLPGACHIREGVVVKPLKERWHQAVGRVQLKVVSAGYLEKGD